MRKNVMAKNLVQTILNSITRYIAIVLIIALGAGMFVGLRTTRSDMVQTGQEYMDGQNMFDLSLMNTYGWSKENLEEIRKIDGVKDAEGVINLDVMARWENSDKEHVYKLYALPETVTKPYLLGGRMPENPNECLVDGVFAGEEILGQRFVISEKNDEDTLDSLNYTTYTVVGYVSSPLYMDMSRGTTSLGNGTVTAFVYIPSEAFDVDYYTEIGITIEGDYKVYSEAYNNAMDAMADYIKPLLEPIAQNRFDTVRLEAEDAYADGMKEYLDGLKEFQDGKAEALDALKEAEQELLDGQKEIDDNRQTLLDALVQIEEGQAAIDENSMTIIASRQQLAAAKAAAYAQIANANSQLLENYKTVQQNLALLEDGLVQLDDGLVMLNDGISQLESGLQQLELMLTLMETMLSISDMSIENAKLALEQAEQSGLVSEETMAQLQQRLQTALDQRAEYQAQYDEMLENQKTYAQQLQDLYVQREELTAQRQELLDNKAMLESALKQIDDGFLELQNSQVTMQNQFASAEAQIESGKLQIELAQTELDANRKQVEDGLTALDEAQRQLDEGWQEFREGRDEALRELGEAEVQLLAVKVELEEARETIDTMDAPAVYALTRNTNTSYVSFESNADIVQGISAVLPAFFLLIAALVCITTMTRMVEEERTQIGTLKALGYSNFAIIGKYIVYAGSAAILGCGLGVFVGSAIFPIILWEAYNIILNIRPNITLLIDWPLCFAVVFAYTAVTLFVTWYSCRMALREVPAELIRPKAPTTGKKIFLEYLPFWNKFSFLNKVMLRNIFRYRQRLLMMLVGIGGCTALLLAGFGVRDSIVDIVDYQFQEVTLYDIEVRFGEDMDLKAQNAFREDIGRYVDRIIFANQSSVELEYDGMARDITMITADKDFENFMDLHRGNEALEMPGLHEALLSIGVAEIMGVQVGDTIVIRNTDMRSMTLTVSGIYDNNVQNYVIVTPETYEANWGEEPEMIMAYISVKDNQDVHKSSTRVAGYEGVMNVMVCDDLAEQIGSMLGALDLVVVTVVVCAGLLAVTVLYNLTNINITERIREIATIKVLGFNAVESALYVFKENLLLSAMGAGCGLLIGQVFLEFIMSQIKVDMVWMPARLLPTSYLLAIVITMLMAVLVDFVLYFKLEKINMAEALKSVE